MQIIFNRMFYYIFFTVIHCKQSEKKFLVTQKSLEIATSKLHDKISKGRVYCRSKQILYQIDIEIILISAVSSLVYSIEKGKT